ncbi:MAG: hypothetical protein M1826_003179 [Phylliscum demangeonii]|nr:MAG: hypothetical protein M1826_003179 [Phylliscum demangeonii]
MNAARLRERTGLRKRLSTLLTLVRSLSGVHPGVNDQGGPRGELRVAAWKITYDKVDWFKVDWFKVEAAPEWRLVTRCMLSYLEGRLSPV